MTWFDWAVIGIVVLSTLFAFFRGLIRELIAIVAWVMGLVAAVLYTPVVAGWLPAAVAEPALRYLIGFVLIVIGVLLAGALIAWPLSHAVRAAGLGFVDRFLGSIFGIARGILVVLALVLVAGLTTAPKSDWWQNSALAAPLSAAAQSLVPYLPRAWTDRLDFSPGGPSRTPAPTKV